MSSTTDDCRITDLNHSDEIYRGLDGRLFALYGWLTYNPGRIGQLLARAFAIDKEAPSWSGLGEGVLRARLLELKQGFRRRARGYLASLPDALAALREAASHRIGLRPYGVQIAGAIGLYEGYLIEMATGEGKTLTAALAAVLNGWSGLPCHVITVNDYLADRDARWMEPLYRYCDLSVGCVTGSMDREQRREQYAKDVVYTTNKELVADFLRDRLWMGNLQHPERRKIANLLRGGAELESGLVMRGIHAAIVDEADSLLIDEAVTPLIISRPQPNEFFLEACRLTHAIAGELGRNSDYLVDERHKEIEILPRLERRLEDLLSGMDARYRGVNGYLDLLQQALSAREFFHRDYQYLVQDGKVVIVDEFTGRQMPQRTWRFGLHQMIEAKENLEMTAPTETLARLSFQRFYRFFHRLAGMTGTAREAADELWAIYHLPVVTIPENRTCRRRIEPPLAFADLETKWRAVVAEIKRIHLEGRPVLAGTRSVRDSETLSGRLSSEGLQHMVLNAVRHREEAGVISLAGRHGSITIATNMAGRGTDIKLSPGVAELGGLHVIACEGNESQRIDRQLFGRSARQGDPGSARLFLSMEDEVVRRFLPAPVRLFIEEQLRRGLPGARLQAVASFHLAQNIAQRVAARRRRSVLQMDTWLDKSLSFAHRDIS